jgi:hypothetical protein
LESTVGIAAKWFAEDRPAPPSANIAWSALNRENYPRSDLFLIVADVAARIGICVRDRPQPTIAQNNFGGRE